MSKAKKQVKAQPEIPNKKQVTVEKEASAETQPKTEKKPQVTDLFKETIEANLKSRASEDPLFAKTFAKKNKNIDDCITYILNTVKASGIAGWADDEIFGMAAHYYDEDEIEIGTQTKCKVVINRTVQLTPEEVEAAKKQAKDKIFRETRDSMQQKPGVKAKPVTSKESQQSLF